MEPGSHSKWSVLCSFSISLLLVIDAVRSAVQLSTLRFDSINSAHSPHMLNPTPPPAILSVIVWMRGLLCFGVQPVLLVVFFFNDDLLWSPETGFFSPQCIQKASSLQIEGKCQYFETKTKLYWKTHAIAFCFYNEMKIWLQVPERTLAFACNSVFHWKAWHEVTLPVCVHQGLLSSWIKLISFL